MKYVKLFLALFLVFAAGLMVGLIARDKMHPTKMKGIQAVEMAGYIWI